MCGAVHDRSERPWHPVVTVMDRHRPDVDKQEEDEIRELVHREAEDVEMIRDAL